MKKIDPLFLLLSSIVIFLIAIFKLNDIENNYIDKKLDYHNYQLLALKYNSKYKLYSDKNIVLKKIQTILNLSNISNATINKSTRKISIYIKDIDIKKVDKVINKLLNTKLNLVGLKITKNSVYFEVELI